MSPVKTNKIPLLFWLKNVRAQTLVCKFSYTRFQPKKQSKFMGFHRKHTCFFFGRKFKVSLFCLVVLLLKFAGIHQLAPASGACVFLRCCWGCSFFLGMSCCTFGASTSFVQRSSSKASGVLYFCLHSDDNETKKKNLFFQYVWAQEKGFRYHFDKT